jgi:hypothetical protein
MQAYIFQIMGYLKQNINLFLIMFLCVLMIRWWRFEYFREKLAIFHCHFYF